VFIERRIVHLFAEQFRFRPPEHRLCSRIDVGDGPVGGELLISSPFRAFRNLATRPRLLTMHPRTQQPNTCTVHPYNCALIN
jgi:hypothetical protein